MKFSYLEFMVEIIGEREDKNYIRICRIFYYVKYLFNLE